MNTREKCFDVLKEHENITISGLQRYAMCSRREAQNLKNLRKLGSR